MLKRLELFSHNRPLDVLMHWSKNGDLLLNPPYQRGDVWGPTRRINLIKSLLTQIPIPSIIVNDRFRAKWKGKDWQFAVIDGKQRITTILMFLNSEFGVPGEWFDMPQEVLFRDLDIVVQRGFRNRTIAISEGVLESIEDEKTVFELVNFGGVPQGESD